MKRITAIILGASALFLHSPVIWGGDTPLLLTGPAAFGDWRDDAPGVRRKITVADLPPPFATESAGNDPQIVPRPSGAELKVPPGFVVDEFASGLDHPREIRAAPNGDLFISESYLGRIRVLRAPDGAAKAQHQEIFASGLTMPFGIAFWPPGPNPQFVYVANTNSVIRFPYRNGDLVAHGPAETIVTSIPGGGRLRGGGHWTRDIVFSKDGSHMFVSVGSRTNDAENRTAPDQPEIQYGQRHAASYPASNVASGRPSAPGGLLPADRDRADVLEFKPDGTGLRIFASGLRNCVGMAVDPLTDGLWCSTNERDGLGDNLPPDYITSVQNGGFYGWPWFYIGGHEDPHHRGEYPELKSKVIVPDVLLQAHSASLEMTFYDGAQFPVDYNLNGGKILNVKVPSARIARITIRNFGRTPAHHLRFGIGVHVEELPLKSPLPAKMPTSIGPRLDILAPHRISTLEVTIPILNALEENMLQTSRAAIHVFGKVTYLDAFGIDRFSAFCLFCVGDGLPEGRLVPCQEGNDSN